MPLAGRSKRLDECKRVGVMRMQLPTSCHHRDLVQILEHPAINWKTQVKILPSRLPFGATGYSSHLDHNAEAPLLGHRGQFLLRVNRRANEPEPRVTSGNLS